MNKALRMAFALTMAAFIAACAVGPDFHHPADLKVRAYTAKPLPKKTASAQTSGGDAQYVVKNREISHQWWTLFQSAPLNTLIEKSLRANPDLQAAKAALVSAQEKVKAQYGYFYPYVGGDINVSRQQVPPSLANATPLGSGQLLFNLYSTLLSASYAPDVWGLNRRTVESLRAQSEYQRFQLAAAYVTLTSNVVAAAIQEASLRAQIDAMQKMIDVNGKMLKMLRHQFSLGYVMRMDVAAQEAQLAQAQARLPSLQQQLAVQRDLLTALAGRFPSEEVPEKFTLIDLHLPKELPVSLPSQLVRQRPDVLSAEEQMHSASAQLGIAVANRLPQFTITANGGYSGPSLRRFFDPYDRFWGLAGNLAEPIFDGGTLLHKQRSAVAAYKQAAAQYRSTVIKALHNVADTLHALQNDAITLKRALAAERAAKVSFDITSQQLKLGDANYLDLLTAELAYQQALINLIQVKAARFTDTVVLFQALGGGWWKQCGGVNSKSQRTATKHPCRASAAQC